MGTVKTCFALSLGFILWILNIQMSCLFFVANWWIQLWSLSCHAFCLLVHFSWILWAISGNHQIAWGLQDSITTIDDAIPSFQIRVLYCRHFFVFCGHSFLRAILHLLFPKSKHDLADFHSSTNCRVYDSSKRQSSFFAPFFKVSLIPTRTLLFANSSSVYNDSSRKWDDAEQNKECESHGGSPWSVNLILFARYLLVMANTFQGHRRTFSDQQSFHSSLWQNEVARKLGNSSEKKQSFVF